MCWVFLLFIRYEWLDPSIKKVTKEKGKFASTNNLKAETLSISPLSELWQRVNPPNISLLTLYSGQFTVANQLITPNHLVISPPPPPPPPMQHHSSFRKLHQHINNMIGIKHIDTKPKQFLCCWTFVLGLCTSGSLLSQVYWEAFAWVLKLMWRTLWKVVWKNGKCLF